MKQKFMKHKKLYSALIAVVLYFWCLVILSHIVSPENYQVTDRRENFLTYEDFSVMYGNEELLIEPDALIFIGDDANSKVFGAEVTFDDLKYIDVSFNLICPQRYAGNVLYVDLFADGYDNAEQDFSITLQEGLNTFHQVIDKGENAPASAYLRIFTLEGADYWITDLTVNAESEPASNFPLAVHLVLFGISMLVYLYFMKKLFW